MVNLSGKIFYSYDAENDKYMFRMYGKGSDPEISAMGSVDWDHLPAEVRAFIRHDLDSRL